MIKMGDLAEEIAYELSAQAKEEARGWRRCLITCKVCGKREIWQVPKDRDRFLDLCETCFDDEYLDPSYLDPSW